MSEKKEQIKNEEQVENKQLSEREIIALKIQQMKLYEQFNKYLEPEVRYHELLARIEKAKLEKERAFAERSYMIVQQQEAIKKAEEESKNKEKKEK